MESERKTLSGLLPGINRKIVEGNDSSALLDFVFEGLLGGIPFDRIGIALLNEQRDQSTLFWVKSRILEKHLKLGYSVPLHKTSLGKIIETLTPRLINDLEAYFKTHPDSESTRKALADGIRSSLTFPLIANCKGVGIVFFSSYETNTYRSEHFEAFGEVSDELAVIVERERLKKYYDSNRAKDLTLARVVHDLRSPLSVNQCCLELLSKQPWSQNLPAATSKIMEMMKRNAKAMKVLVEDLSDLNSMDLAVFKLHKNAVDLGPFVEDIRERSELMCRKKEIDFKVEFSSDVPKSAVFDSDRIFQVVDNLVNNAVKFSARGKKIVFQINCTKDKIQFSVVDQGQGIPENEFSKLFQDFGQTTIRPTEGERSTGLGLAIVKRIIELHDGEVSVESNLGIGSRFSFCIPYLKPELGY